MTQEKDLIARARKLEESGLRKIYDRYSEALYCYAYRHLGSQQVAEDILSQTFERFLKALHSGGGPDDHLQAYLYRIAHNLISDHYRREPPPPLQLEEDLYSQDENQPDRIVGELEQTKRIRAALRLLTDEQRQVIMLRFLEGWSTKEVARSLGKTRGAVRAQQHRALASLERILSRDEIEADKKS